MVQGFREPGIQGCPAAPTLPDAALAERRMRPDAARPSVAVIQDGARLHYALPLALQREGALDAAFTDWFVRPGSRDAAPPANMRPPTKRLGKRQADPRGAAEPG